MGFFINILLLLLLLLLLKTNAEFSNDQIKEYYTQYLLEIMMNPEKQEKEIQRWDRADPHIVWMSFEQRYEYADDVIRQTCDNVPLDVIRELFEEVDHISLLYKVNCAAVANISLMAKKLNVPWKYHWFIFKQRILRIILSGGIEPIKHYLNF